MHQKPADSGLSTVGGSQEAWAEVTGRVLSLEKSLGRLEATFRGSYRITVPNAKCPNEGCQAEVFIQPTKYPICPECGAGMRWK